MCLCFGFLKWLNAASLMSRTKIKISSASDLLPPSFPPHVSPLPLSLLPSIVSLLFWSPLWVAPGPRLASVPSELKRMFFPGFNCLSWPNQPPAPSTSHPHRILLKQFVVCEFQPLPGLEWKKEKKNHFGFSNHQPKTNLHLQCFPEPYMKWETFCGKQSSRFPLQQQTNKQVTIIYHRKCSSKSLILLKTEQLQASSTSQ